MTSPHARPLVAVVLAVAVVAAVGCSRRNENTTSSPSTSSGPASPVVGTAPPKTGPWSANPPVEPTAQTVEGTLRTADGRDRTYRVYVPSSAKPGEPVPLLVAMHGGLGSASQFEENSGFDGVAEANGFIVVYPDGVGSAIKDDLGQTWNGGDCCGPAMNQNVDDVAFLRQLVGQMQQTYTIDADRVYAAGHSNGGIMAYRLACEASDVFAAVGLQASALELDTCAPSKPVSLIHIHGTADRNLPIDGGEGQGVSGVTFNPPIDGVRTIARADGCPAEPIASADPANTDVMIDTWQPCADGTEVQFVKVAGATHAWMGGQGPQRPAQRALVGEAYDRYSSSPAIWAFLAAHPRR